MKDNGFLVRRPFDHQFLNNYVRITIGKKSEMKAFFNALDKFN